MSTRTSFVPARSAEAHTIGGRGRPEVVAEVVSQRLRRLESDGGRDDIDRLAGRLQPALRGHRSRRLRLARLGRPVKKMIGGITGWKDEGFTLARS